MLSAFFTEISLPDNLSTALSPLCNTTSPLAFLISLATVNLYVASTVASPNSPVDVFANVFLKLTVPIFSSFTTVFVVVWLLLISMSNTSPVNSL